MYVCVYRAPDPKNDAPWRKWQGMYLPAPMSLLFLIWRVDSIRVAIERRDVKEILGLVCACACACGCVKECCAIFAVNERVHAAQCLTIAIVYFAGDARALRGLVSY